jgi:ferrous iron transport protein A
MQNIQSVKSNTLAQLPVGEEARVISVEGNNPIAKRLMEMGIIPGVSVRVIKTAPFGSPLEVKVRGYHLALRKSEAETIEVQTSN